MNTYLTTTQHILDHGDLIDNRTGCAAITYIGLQTRYNMSDGFPACTTKRLAWKAVVSELLWFIEGSSDVNRLKAILGKDKTIWDANADADYWKPKAKFDGDLGRVYGVQWRSWAGTNSTHDQLSNVIESIKKTKADPSATEARRLIVSAWNPAELDQMALPPCHLLFQFHVVGNYLDLQMYQRSSDQFLGVPFNIASYSLLLCMVAQVTDLIPRTFIHDQGNAHIYLNHVAQVKEQLSRTPKVLPTLALNSDITCLYDFTMDDIALIDYHCDASISAPMAV